jgi:dihydrofolate reductase
MSRIVISEFITLDGIIDEPTWTFQFDRGPAGDQYKLDELFASEALLLGRVTYQGFAQAWPSMTDEFAAKMNGMIKYVVSQTLTDADATWNNTTVLRDDLVTEVAALRAAPGRDVLVYGSSQLAQALLREGLVDELRLMMSPIVLGRGKRMFPAGDAQLTFDLADARPASSGVMLLTYQRAGQ